MRIGFRLLKAESNCRDGTTHHSVLKELLNPEHDIDWTVLSPPMAIVSGERTEKFRLGLDDVISDARSIEQTFA